MAAGTISPAETSRRYGEIHLMTLAEAGSLLAFAQGDAALAGLLFLGTAALVALCVPGVITAMSISSAAILGAWAAVPVVTLGALVGSLILFLGVRRADSGRTRAKLGPRFAPFEQRFTRHGLWYVVALRLCGAPHFLVTAGSALLPVRASGFAAASLAGLLPVVAVYAVAGSLL
jgi:uncharacterized membrane protein YdjX (TVP38/TMEM64 family)